MSAAFALPAPTDNLWISKGELVRKVGFTERWLEIQTRKSETAYLTREVGKSRNGRPNREYYIPSLPAELQARLLPPARPSPSPLALVPTAPLFAQPHVVKATAVSSRSVVPPSLRGKVAERLALIQPLLDYANDPGRFASLKLADGRAVRNVRLLAVWIVESEAAQGRSVKERTLFLWKAAYLSGGEAALAPKRRTDKGLSRWASKNRDLADLAMFICIGDKHQPPQSKQVAWEQVCLLAEARGLEKPSYETVRAFLENPNEVSRSMKTLAKSGEKGYKAQFANYLRRSYTEPSNSIWVSDHQITDVLVQDDLFNRDFHHCRLQLTTLLDYRSRMVVGWSWSLNGSSHSIKRALLRAILSYGPPEKFYCDNGKDYRKVGRDVSQHGEAILGEMQQLQTSVLRKLGIETIFCKPFHPQSKHVERYHGTYHARFDQVFPTYTAGLTHLRPDNTVEAMAEHKKLVVMGDTGSSRLPLASEYIALAEAWIEQVYNRRPMSDRAEGMNGRSPAQCFAEELNPNQRATPPLEELVLLLAETRQASVRNCAVEINKVRFVPSAADPRAAVVMHERSGRRDKVLVAFDPLDMTRAVVLDSDGHALCSLVCETKTRFADDDETRAQISAMEQQRGMLLKAVKENTVALSQRVQKLGYKRQADQLRELAGIAPQNATSNIVQKPRRVKMTASGETAPISNVQAVEAFFSELAR